MDTHISNKDDHPMDDNHLLEFLEDIENDEKENGYFSQGVNASVYADMYRNDENPIVRPSIPSIFNDPDVGRTIPIYDSEGQNVGNHRYLKVCAPMVRYSKLCFRQLVNSRETDIVYTPMILSDVYKYSTVARSNEFLTNINVDNNVVVQFASAKPDDFIDASKLVAPFCNGVDLNCGCPQPWAFKEKIGSYLMESPQTVWETVRQFNNQVNYKMADGTNLPMGVKIRIHKDFDVRTVDYVRGLIKSGVSWITIHGRTRKQRNTDPVNIDAIKHLVEFIHSENASIPVIANGDLTSIDDCDQMASKTLSNGVMAARGILENPDMFISGEKKKGILPNKNTIKEFNHLSVAYGGTHFINHHHLMFMFEDSMTKTEKKYFNVLPSITSTIDYLDDFFDIQNY